MLVKIAKVAISITGQVGLDIVLDVELIKTHSTKDVEGGVWVEVNSNIVDVIVYHEDRKSDSKLGYHKMVMVILVTCYVIGKH